MNFVCFDLETMKSVFSAGFFDKTNNEYVAFEISPRKNEGDALFKYICDLRRKEYFFVGFNSHSFDMPVIHHFLKLWMTGIKDPDVIRLQIHEYANEIIRRRDRFFCVRKPMLKSIDLFKVHHYDNPAKSTSLKKLEFALGMDNIEELPYAPDADLLPIQIQHIMDYMHHDVKATDLFFDASKSEIDFRFSMVEEHGEKVLNFSDSKIGSEIMVGSLIEKLGYSSVFTQDDEGRRIPVQTKREQGFKVGNLLFPYLKFETEPLQKMHEFLSGLVLTDTKGMFNELTLEDVGDLAPYVELELTPTEQKKQNVRDLIDSGDFITDSKGVVSVDVTDERYVRMNAYAKRYQKFVNGEMEDEKDEHRPPTKIRKFNIKTGNTVDYFGTGGLHASINGIVSSNDEFQLVDLDFTSMYPRMSIVNYLSPAQFGSKEWVEIYNRLFEERMIYPKTDPRSKALKLAMNSTYGNSGNRYSPIYDPAYTVSTCLNGQLTLSMMTERWFKIPGLKIISKNTDGANAAVPRKHMHLFKEMNDEFEHISKLECEWAYYSDMYNPDVNNYIWVPSDPDGNRLKDNDGNFVKNKLKGRYNYDLGFHQNHSQIIVRRAAEKHLVDGINISEYLRSSENHKEFCIMAKVDRRSRLMATSFNDEGDVIKDIETNRITRYAISSDKRDPMLFKYMPPLEGKEADGDRKFGIAKDKNVIVCSDISNFDWSKINYDYYEDEVKKLCDIPRQRIIDL